MKTIITELEEIRDSIKYDLNLDWNDNKLTETIQLFKIEQALALLSSVGKNRNIEDS